MKKILILLTLAFISTGLFAQENFGGLSLTDTTNSGMKLVIEQADSTRAITLLNFLDSLTLTGLVTIPTPFTLGAVSVTPTGTELNYVDGVTSDIQTQFDGIDAELIDTAGLETLVIMLTDTLITGGLIGMGNAGDTALFSTGDVIWAVEVDGSHNMVIAEVKGVNGAGSEDIDINLYYDVNFKDATPTEVLNGDLTITSNTTSQSSSTFSNQTVAAGNFLWVVVNQATAQPTQFLLTIKYSLTDVF